MIKVAFVKFGGMANGGTEKYLQTIAAYLPKDEFDMISEHIESSSFPWYWNNHSVAKDGITQFFHAFMNREGINSDYFNLLTNTSIFPRLGAKGLVKCKANLNYPTIENQTGVFHTDFNDAQNKNIITFFGRIDIKTSFSKF